MRTTLAMAVAALVLLGSLPRAQSPAPVPLTLITAQGRRPLPTTVINGQEMVATDELVAQLQVAAREDTAAGGITLSYKGRTVVVSPDKPMASVGGRLIPLPSPAVRSGRRWLVPLDAVPRALGPIYDARIELRRPSRLLIVGDLRVPRVTVRIESAGPPTRMSIEASPATLLTPVIESGRVTLRVDADALDVAPLPQSAGLLEQARTEGSIVVLMLSPRAGQARASQAAAENLSRINLEIPIGAQAEGQAPQASPTTPAPQSPVDATPPGLPPLGAVRVVVLDPGHGGDDAGTTGPSGAQEKTLVLEIARQVKGLLETRLGLRVLLTREDDQKVTVDQRASLANTSRASLFISLHLNASPSPKASGAEIYLFGANRVRPTGGRTAARDEPFSLPLAAGGSRSVALVPWDDAQARHLEDSTLLANLLESALRARIPMSARPIQEAPMRVLAAVDAPAVVVELAYLSNPEQDAAVQTDDFKVKAAQSIVDAVSTFRSAAQGDR